nr:metalloregulator ArsR/SmtB family transcription factor [Phytoactinopolyspora mesophila]
MSSTRPVEWLRILADPLRLQIVELLAREALCTCHIVEMTGARQTNVSNHLRLMRQAGIVEIEPHGRYTYYRLSAGVVRQLAGYLQALAAAAAIVDEADVRRPCP